MAARVLIVAATDELSVLLSGRPTITVVGRIRPGTDLSLAVADLHPDVILREAPTGILVDDPVAQGAGARGVLRRDASPDEIAVAIEAVALGLTVLHPDAVPRPTPRDGATEALTRREREILALLADGLGNKVIAARLGISDHTVKAHVGAIFDKLHVGTRAEAVALGLRLGLIAL